MISVEVFGGSGFLSLCSMGSSERGRCSPGSYPTPSAKLNLPLAQGCCPTSPIGSVWDPCTCILAEQGQKCLIILLKVDPSTSGRAQVRFGCSLPILIVAKRVLDRECGLLELSPALSGFQGRAGDWLRKFAL